MTTMNQLSVILFSILPSVGIWCVMYFVLSRTANSSKSARAGSCESKSGTVSGRSALAAGH